MAVNAWADGCYLNADGVMATGWLQLGDSWYYLNNDGKSQKGWQTIKNKRYYFDENGIMLKNAWVGNRYVKDSGAMATGWLQLGDSWYYLNNDGKSQKGWQTIKNKRYFFDENGVMASNTWVGGRYVNENGVMVTGWVQLGDNWYYLNKNGGNNSRAGGAENKQQGKRENGEGRQNKKPRDGYQRRDRNRGPKQPRENQGQFQDSPKPSMPIKKREETVEDIRSENARITKEIYLDIAAMKNISLD